MLMNELFNHNLIIFIYIYHFTFILWDSEGAKVMALMILEGPAYLFPALLVFIVDFNLFRLDGGLTAKRSQLGSIDGQGKVIPKIYCVQVMLHILMEGK